MNRDTIDRLMEMCANPPTRGQWKAFCEQEGISYWTLMYWRNKLKLARVVYPKRKIVKVSVTLISA